MKKSIRLTVGLFAGAIAACAWAQPDPARQLAKEAQREARAQHQMQREQRRIERVEAMREFRAAQPGLQPGGPMPIPPTGIAAPPRPPLAAPQPVPLPPAGAPRRLTPEERQQLRDQIRDARRMYQQGQ